MIIILLMSNEEKRDYTYCMIEFVVEVNFPLESLFS